MVRTNAGSYGYFEVGGLLNTLGGEVPGPEGLRDDYIGVRQLSFEDGVRPILVRRYDELMPPFIQETPQPKSAGNRSQKVARIEVYGGRRGQSLTVRVVSEAGYTLAGVVGRKPSHRVGVEDTQHFLRRRGTHINILSKVSHSIHQTGLPSNLIACMSGRPSPGCPSPHQVRGKRHGHEVSTGDLATSPVPRPVAAPYRRGPMALRTTWRRAAALRGA